MNLDINVTLTADSSLLACLGQMASSLLTLVQNAGAVPPSAPAAPVASAAAPAAPAAGSTPSDAQLVTDFLARAQKRDQAIAPPAPAAPVSPPTSAVPVTPTPPATAPAPSTPAPAVPVAPTTPSPGYTLEQLSTAGANLTRADPSKMAQLVALLQQYGVQAVTQLAPEHYGAFATALRGLGAAI
jgi:hypothetical protein